MNNSNYRLRELDFLRGLAILLVLFRHHYVSDFTHKMGWIGVDLFFVLSGFLVSGLLFKEYIKYGNIKPKLFLIRRGFKIYPIYFIFYVLYLIPILIKKKLLIASFLSDMFFIQNYSNGWGYAYAASWSLAVEEHFYFMFAILLFIGIKTNKIIFIQHKSALDFSFFEKIILTILLICLVLRLISNLYFPNLEVKTITMTHLRIDSLLAGVLVSYWYYFKKEFLFNFISLNKFKLYILVLILISFTPFIEYIDSFFVKTIGFTMLYIAFGLILALFLTDDKINNKINFILSKRIVNIICKIGFSSYSIYIIHTFINYIFNLFQTLILHQEVNNYLSFFITSTLSLVCGYIMTTVIEKYFLNIRDKYYPSRII